MLEPIAPMRWLFQPIVVPLIGLLIAILLPAGFLAKAARQKVKDKFGIENGD